LYEVPNRKREGGLQFGFGGLVKFIGIFGNWVESVKCRSKVEGKLILDRRNTIFGRLLELVNVSLQGVIIDAGWHDG
jgi:hypothetical protein